MVSIMITKDSNYNKLRDDLYCKFCGKKCKNLNSLDQHQIRCKENPDKIKFNTVIPGFNNFGRKAWNKGLTKETDERVKKNSESVSKFYHTEAGEKLKEEFSTKFKEMEAFKVGGRKGGLISANSQQRRSKNEIYFCELCENYFKQVKHNEPIFNGWDADIIIEDYKIAVLWNGVWHYKKVNEKHSLEQVQSRDKIRLDQIEACGYKPYIIKDMGKENKKFVEEEFDKFIQNLKNLQ